MDDTQKARLPIIISGGSGQLGQLVINELLETYRVPVDQLIVVTRSPEKLENLSQKGLIVRPGDYDQVSSLPSAYAGGKTMFLISTYPDEKPKIRDVVADRRRPTVQKAAIDAAIKAGVQHIVYTSAPNPEPGTPCYWLEEHYETEKHLIESGATWTILRNGEFPDFYLENDLVQAITTGEYYTTRGDGKMNHAWREDCATAAAGALVSDISVNRRFDLTGPDALTVKEIVGIVSEILGKEIKIIQCEPVVLRNRYQDLKTFELDPNLIEVMLDVNIAVRSGRHADITNGVELLSGRPSRSLKEFIQSNISKIL